MRHLLSTAAAFVLLSLPAAAAEPSAFGCANLADNQLLPTIEGKDGFFFRVMADLRMQNSFTDAAADQLAALSAALEANGTTLIYVPIPTKGQTLAAFLPETAALYGFDTTIAQEVYRDIVARLGARGVTAVDLIPALTTTDGEHPTFFQADFHWTSEGARNAAQAIATAMTALPGSAELTRKSYTSEPTGEETPVSTMRRTLQPFCADALPVPKTTGYVTREVEDPNATLDIFGSDGDAARIALVGTSFSEAGPQNFAGFLQEFTGLEVVNYSVTGGNQFGAILSYLTSAEFYENRPRYLIWENPVYNSLADFGSGPMSELIAAAANACVPIAAPHVTVTDAGSVRVDLSKQQLERDAILLADAGNESSRELVLEFADSSAGPPIRYALKRNDRQRGTGRYFVPLASLPRDHLATVNIIFDRFSHDGFSVSLCSSQKG